jgi:hypothetical protein
MKLKKKKKKQKQKKKNQGGCNHPFGHLAIFAPLNLIFFLIKSKNKK